MRLLFFCALFFLSACATQPPSSPPAADHHVHIRSPLAGEALPRVQLARGKDRRALSPGLQTADDLIQQMERYHIRQAAILSLGYMYALPELDFDHEREKVAQENDFVIQQAQRFPDRLVAFCGISPLADYALDELRRCARKGATGIKMHLANSDVDLDRAQDRAALEAVFRQANQDGLAIAIHFRPRGVAFGTAQARYFMQELAPLAPDVPIQLAHLGGGGIVDAATLSAIETYAESLEAVPNLYFDLSAAWARTRDFPRSVGRTELTRNRQGVARAVELLGADRILFASDWDSIEVQDTLRPLLQGRGLSRETIKRILSNRAPYLP